MYLYNLCRVCGIQKDCTDHTVSIKKLNKNYRFGLIFEYFGATLRPRLICSTGNKEAEILSNEICNVNIT